MWQNFCLTLVKTTMTGVLESVTYKSAKSFRIQRKNTYLEKE